MRGTVAKRLRAIARKQSKPTEYKTKWYSFFTGKYDEKGEKVLDYRGKVTCTGYRRVYQALKQQYLFSRYNPPRVGVGA